mgnify:CR=1 FL=1
MTPFWITGLPRSRTAWMSAFLTNGDVFCHHEFLKDCTSREMFYEAMSVQDKRIGNSDTGLVVTDFQTRFPDSKTVIIDRDPVDVYVSLSEIYEGINLDNFWSMVQDISELKGMRVPFDRLDDEMPNICEYLDIPYDKARHELFKILNIQTTDLVLRHETVKVWR